MRPITIRPATFDSPPAEGDRFYSHVIDDRWMPATAVSVERRDIAPEDAWRSSEPVEPIGYRYAVKIKGLDRKEATYEWSYDLNGNLTDPQTHREFWVDCPADHPDAVSGEAYEQIGWVVSVRVPVMFTDGEITAEDAAAQVAAALSDYEGIEPQGDPFSITDQRIHVFSVDGFPLALDTPEWASGPKRGFTIVAPAEADPQDVHREIMDERRRNGVERDPSRVTHAPAKRPGRKRDPHVRAKVAELVDAGKSAAEIAAEIGKSTARVYQILAELRNETAAAADAEDHDEAGAPAR